MSVTQPKDKLDVQVSILRLFSCGAATAYSLGREPQVLSRQRRKAAERRPRYDEVNSDCGRRSAASRAFCLVFLGLTPQAICGRCSAAVVRATSTLVRRACTLVMLASICVFAGCGDSLPATVSGKVTIDGKDLSGNENVTGNVVFYPSGGGAAAFGNVSAGGNYEVTTGSTKGIEPGEYKVTARVIEIEPPPAGGQHKVAPPQKLLSPERYSDIEKTDLKFTVEAGSQTLDLDLSSK